MLSLEEQTMYAESMTAHFETRPLIWQKQARLSEEKEEGRGWQ